jgi:CubicO group peptidase (beta-lactamase class C family)
MKRQQVQYLLQFAIRQGIGSGAAAAFGNLSNQKFDHLLVEGVTSLDRFTAQKVQNTTFFDLASLTKIIVTTSVCLKKYEQGQLDLNLPLQDSAWAANGFSIAQLLSHTSGLPAWNSFYENVQKQFGASLKLASLQDRQQYFDRLVAASICKYPVGQQTEYSDVGFLLLGQWLEKQFQADLISLFEQTVLNGMPQTTFHYRPLYSGSGFNQIDPSVVATEVCPDRGWLQGQVHDDNTSSRGGIAPHAGLFGSIEDVTAWIHELFSGRFVSFLTLKTFTQQWKNSGRALGFDLPARDGSGSTGSAFSMNSVGHLGYTGTSLWVDLDSGDYAVLLTNRLHSRQQNPRLDHRIRNLRQDFHRIVRSL